ncbi:esterase E4-like isoform X1 [Planococcus citri]|uniref:esterase E4-like isoform X1 n=1 Tax=Planococcus citri TaxID=170843 RepID=UPI0031F911AE
MTDKVYVSVNEGKIKGIRKTSNFSGVEYFSFLGVPYGQPPVGSARFKDPVKIKPWKDTLNATFERDGCRQFSLLKREFSGSEDCLYNNIHTPQLPKENEPLKSVIVCIHPGGYFYGSADPSQFGSPEFIMHHDIVYVCVNHRLHILGYLNLGLKECSGCQGLKDVILSLEWIKDNISVFGGDPNNITIIGSSSGSAIVHALMFAPRAKGLFHKAVLMGMYGLNPTLVTQHEHVTNAFELAKSLGYDGTADDRKRLLAFYKKVDIDDIVILRPEALFSQNKIAMFPASTFLPTVDKDDDIQPGTLQELLPSTVRVPMMIGFCKNEGAMGFIKLLKEKLRNNFYSTLTQNVWSWGSELTDEDLKKIEKQAEMFYLNGQSTQKASLSQKCDIQTDIALSDVYNSLINIVAEDLPSSVFVYRFDYEGSIPTMKERIASQLDEPLKGTCHGDDYSYWAMIKDHWSKLDYSIQPRSREMVEKFTKLITTFAKTGDPNYEGLEVHWKSSSIENPHYLSFDDPLTVIEGKLNGKRMEFWENIKKQFKKK